MYDSAYRRPRQIWVYTPPGFTAGGAVMYPLIVAFDGAEYRDTMPLPRVLDTLLATHSAPAFIAVLIDDSLSSARIADLGNAGKMVQFLVTATEVPGGNHAPEWWRQRLAYGIATLAAAWH